MAKDKKKSKSGKKASKKKAAARKSGSGKTASARKKTTSKRTSATKAGRKKSESKKAARKKAGGKKPAARRPAKKAGKKAGKKAARKKATKKKRATKKRGERGKEFFDHFRQRLLDERAQIGRRLDELREELRGLEESPPRELEEWAQEEKDRDILIRLEERETLELRRIQAALGLIDSGEYGRCQDCGRPIPRARLEELPTAFRCIEHTP